MLYVSHTRFDWVTWQKLKNTHGFSAHECQLRHELYHTIEPIKPLGTEPHHIINDYTDLTGPDLLLVRITSVQYSSRSLLCTISTYVSRNVTPSLKGSSTLCMTWFIICFLESIFYDFPIRFGGTNFQSTKTNLQSAAAHPNIMNDCLQHEITCFES